ncbi:MAG: hypothetical protein IJU40_06295, partial [Desulfovibrionaceae bacterium]|nr:hypothetical protein [Desulfovibrionaceae bacterium]
MGKAKTLADFITYCCKNYPADHKMLIIWNHGGGSIGEIADDENFNMDGLYLEDLHKALALSLENNPDHPPLDIIGFDACLMGSIDVANAIYGFAKYMVASQEWEPTYGWFYTPWLNSLNKEPHMKPEKLGKLICNSFIKGCQNERAEGYDPSESATLSLINLAEIPTLKLCWNLLGIGALSKYADQDQFATYLSRTAHKAHKFLNSKDDGYSNMMDLGSYTKLLRQDFPEEADLLLEQLKNTVLYKVSGKKHKAASGLSCYFPYDKGRTYSKMVNKGNMSAFVILQGLQLNKLKSDLALKYLEKIIEE